MKRLSFAFGCLLLAMTASATAEWRHGERQPVWPEGKIPNFQAHQIGAMTDEVKDAGFKPDEHRMPYLEWFEKPAKPNGACMILVSGGSYMSCCDVGLIKLWKETFSNLGYQTVNLVYRTPRAKGLPVYQSAWEDGQRAVRLVRSQAAARGFDPEKIGVIGMSAGGHLVTMLATSALTPAYAKIDALDELPCHVNWCIAHAPAYNTATSAGGDARPQDGTTFAPSVNPCFKFDAKTCPISFHHGGTDPYTPNGSTLCYRELRKRGVPAELHLYADKAHGAHGLERALEFLNQMEFVAKLGRAQAQDHRFMPGDTIRTEKEYLWPAGQKPDAAENQRYEPYLVWFVPEKLTTKAIQVVVPGGGYGFCNFNGEGTPVAHYLNGKGMTTVVVMYRCPRPPGRPKHLSGWQDAQRAIRLVRHEAPARGLDPDRIGLMGFSAGGHLTLMTATNARTPAYEPVDDIDRLPCKVQWACPIYPAYALTDGADIPNTTGGNDDSAVLVPEFAFDADTPPMCFVHGDADGWAAMNSVKCWEKLRTMGVQSDLHTLAKRGHCFQFNASPGTGSWTWLDQVWDFLSRKGLNR
ncbi:MAG: alpha/beta hydrolase [Kiritimatiellia bacterium]